MQVDELLDNDGNCYTRGGNYIISKGNVSADQDTPRILAEYAGSKQFSYQG